MNGGTSTGGSASASGGGSAGGAPAHGGSDSGGSGLGGAISSSGGKSAAGGGAGGLGGGISSSGGKSAAGGGGAGGSGPVVPTCLKSVGLGDVYLRVVDGEGAVACRGKNDSGQLGIGGATSSSDTFRAVSGFDAPVTSVWTGYGENYAITETGKVFRWGYVDFLTRDDVVPRPVDYSAQLPNALKVPGGASHHCAQNADNTLLCWGANNLNQLSDGSTGHVEPRAIPGLEMITELARNRRSSPRRLTLAHHT